MAPKGKGSGHNKVPERWEEYTDMGRQIPGTKFIAFKVPLREGIMNNVEGAGWWCPRTLTDHCHNLGLVVDLTNTNRYYDPKAFLDQGIEYAKLYTEGKVIPSKDKVHKFFNIVNKYLKENKDNDKLIGVHCTHGLNRAGYMVCRYMIHQLGIPSDQAIADFNSARGHAQEREEYLKDLREAPWIDEVVAVDPNASEDKKPTTPSSSRGRTSTNESVSYDDGKYSISPPNWSVGPVRRWSNSPATPEGGAGWRESRRRSSNPYSTSRPQRQYSQDNRQQRHIEQHSPYEAQRYYDSRYQGRVAPQYRHDFYQQQGSGFGPQRTQTRWASKAYQERESSSYRPRQYRGPRPYRSPERRNEEEATSETPQEKQRDDYSSTPQHQPRRSLRNQVFTPEENKRQPFSPGDRDNVFTPDNSSRRRSARWNPY